MKNKELFKYWQVLLHHYFKKAIDMDDDDIKQMLADSYIEPIDANHCLVGMDEMFGVYTHTPSGKIIYKGDE